MDFEDVCIICLENICSKDAIWSCSTCYGDYHLVCINDWISKHRKSREQLLNDEQRNMNLSEGYEVAMGIVNKLMIDTNHWSCPKCRHEYPLDEAPNKYFCYCGKISDPKGNNWLKPHTCGEKCGKFLKPYCGDICYDLCHWGPCQPCPKMLPSASCYCGKKSRNAIRCSQRYWSCENTCSKVLSCGLHNCGRPCHEKSCAPCETLVRKNCLCELQSMEVKCSETWKCSKSCKPIDKSLLNKCPCGKRSLDSIGNGDHNKLLTTCTDTCDKVLDCGVHRCVEKCHLGDCGLCRQMVTKSCRCGSSVAMVVCHKELTCNTKCARWKSCGKHQCRRRCCDPSSPCSQCDVICNNFLSCRKHRCQMRCHIGPCYPCQQTVEVSCACGSKQSRVACGAKRDQISDLMTSRCKNPCQIPSKCRHNNSHKCHSKSTECPPCKDPCKSLLVCGHECNTKCHDAVKTTLRLDKSKLAGPWEAVNDGMVTYVSQDCPPCAHQLSLICMGGHEILMYQCWQKLEFASCGRGCGRLLSCENHYCTVECHQTSKNKCPDVLIGDKVQTMKASSYCLDVCDKLCDKPLVKNPCSHQCPKILCHRGVCPPCTRYVTHKCHCGSLDLHIECHLGPNPPQAMLCCPARCSRYLTKACKHQCPSTCHPGNCDDLAVACKTKLVRTCPCGRKKTSVACWKSSTVTVSCDPIKCSQDIGPDSDVRKRNGKSTVLISDPKSRDSQRVKWLSKKSLGMIVICSGLLLVVVWALYVMLL